MAGDKRERDHSDCLTKEAFLEIIKSQEYQQVLNSAIYPIIAQLQQEVTALKNDLTKAKQTIARQDLEISKLKQDYSKVSTSVDDLGKSLRIQQRNEKMKNLDCQEKKIKSRTSVYNCQLKVTVKPEEVTLRKAAREGVSVQLVFTNIWTRKTCYRERTKLIFSMGLLSNLYERAMIGVLENTCLSFDLSQILSQSHCSDW